MNHKFSHLVVMVAKSLIVAVMLLGIGGTAHAGSSMGDNLPDSNTNVITESNRIISIPWDTSSSSKDKYFMPERCGAYISDSEDGRLEVKSPSPEPKGNLGKNGGFFKWLFPSVGYNQFVSKIDMSDALYLTPGAISIKYFHYGCANGSSAFSGTQDVPITRGVDDNNIIITAPENFINSNSGKVLVFWKSGSNVSGNCKIGVTDLSNNKIGSFEGKGLNGEAKVAIRNISSNGVRIGVQCNLINEPIKLASAFKELLVSNVRSDAERTADFNSSLKQIRVNKNSSGNSSVNPGSSVSSPYDYPVSDAESVASEKAYLKKYSKRQQAENNDSNNPSPDQGALVSSPDDSSIQPEPSKKSDEKSAPDNGAVPDSRNLSVISASIGAKAAESGVTLYWSSSNASACRIWDSYSQKTKYNLPPSGTYSIGNGFCGQSKELNYAVRCFNKENVGSMYSDATSLGASDRGFLMAQSCTSATVSLDKPLIKKFEASQSTNGKSVSVSWDTDGLKSCRLFFECPNISSETRYGGSSGSESFDVAGLEDGKSCFYRIRCFKESSDVRNLSNYGGVDQSGSILVKKTSGITDVSSDSYPNVNFTANTKFDGKKMNLSWNASPLSICRLSSANWKKVIDNLPAKGNYSADLSDLSGYHLLELQCFSEKDKAEAKKDYSQLGVKKLIPVYLNASNPSENGIYDALKQTEKLNPSPLIPSSAGVYKDNAVEVSFSTSNVSGSACRVWFGGTRKIERTSSSAKFDVSNITSGNYVYRVCCYQNENEYKSSDDCLSSRGVLKEGLVSIPSRPSEAKIDPTSQVMPTTPASGSTAAPTDTTPISVPRAPTSPTVAGTPSTQAICPSSCPCGCAPGASTCISTETKNRCSNNYSQKRAGFQACPGTDTPAPGTTPSYTTDCTCPVVGSPSAGCSKTPVYLGQNKFIGSVGIISDVVAEIVLRILSGK